MQKIAEFKSLRFFLFLMIFFHHCGLYSGGGTLGVTYFFVLSGFSLTLGYDERIFVGDFDYKTYIKRRISSYFPFHWLCLCLTVLSVLVLGTGQSILLKSFLPNALLIQSFVPSSDYYFSFNSLSWYLSDTFFFAICFPFIIKGINACKGNLKVLPLFVTFALYVCIVVCGYLFKVNQHWLFYINPITRSVDFVLGIYLAKFVLNLGIMEKEEKIREFVLMKKGILFSIIVFAFLASIAISFIIHQDYSLISAFYWIPISIVIVGLYIISVIGSGISFLRNMVLVELGGGLLLCT